MYSYYDYNLVYPFNAYFNNDVNNNDVNKNDVNNDDYFPILQYWSGIELVRMYFQKHYNTKGYKIIYDTLTWLRGVIGRALRTDKYIYISHYYS